MLCQAERKENDRKLLSTSVKNDYVKIVTKRSSDGLRYYKSLQLF